MITVKFVGVDAFVAELEESKASAETIVRGEAAPIPQHPDDPSPEQWMTIAGALVDGRLFQVTDVCAGEASAEKWLEELEGTLGEDFELRPGTRYEVA